MLSGKTFLDYSNLFSPNDYKKNVKIIYKYFKDKYGKRSKSRVYINSNWWNKKLYLEVIKYNGLMSEKYKKTFKYLNYVEHLLISVSTVTVVFQFLYLLH